MSFRITNADPDLAISDVAFIDPLPVGMQPVDDPPVPSDNGECGSYTLIWYSLTKELNFSGGEIQPGAVCIVELEVEVPGVDVSAGAVTFANQSGTVSHVFRGMTYVGNDAEATLLVDSPIPAIALLKLVGLASDPEGAWSSYLPVELGGQVFYKLTVENIGETVLTDIAVSDPTVDMPDCSWPASLPVADAGDPEAHIAVCVVGPVDADTAGVFTNTAGVVTTQVPGPTTDTATTSVTQSGSLTIAKTQTSGPSPATVAGQTLGYTIVVTNTGTVGQTGVTVSDTLPDGSAATLSGPVESIATDGVLGVGETWTYTTSYTVTQADIDAGANLVNTASVATTELPTSLVSTATTAVSQSSVAASVVKEASPASGTPVAPGATITYTLSVVVSGGPTTADIVLTDTLDADLSFGSVTSNPGGFVAGGSGSVRTFTLPSGAADGLYEVAYTATVNAGTIGTVTNDVSVTGGGGSDPICVSCSTGHPVPSDIQAIPTASTWGLLLLMALIAGAAWHRLARGGL